MIQIEYVSDITFSPVAKLIASGTSIEVNMIGLDISQHIQVLKSPSSRLKSDVLILHCTSNFFSSNLYVNHIDEFMDALESFVKMENAPWVVINTIEIPEHSFVGVEQVKLLVNFHNLNARLANLAIKHRKLRLVDIGSTVSKLGLDLSLSQKSNYIMKLPYRAKAVQEVASKYISILEDIYLARKKVLVLDADNTLWGGVVGEDGCDGIKIDPFNYPGVAYWNFQLKLKEIKNSGIILVLVSKNNEADVFEVFDKIKMPLGSSDFILKRINWINKAQNISEVSDQLGLGLDSFVFLDDNKFEVEHVRHSLPAVSCYQFPADLPEDGISLLKNIPRLSTWRITDEDVAKSKLYEEEVLRQNDKLNSASLQDYLESLNLKLEYGLNRESQIGRITQLINKTNQFNLTTRRYSENEVAQMMSSENVYDFRVVDKYGDMGIVGVCIVKSGNIDVFLMSCRALGREVESTMLKIVCSNNNLNAEFVLSKKNQMVCNFYEQNGFDITYQDEFKKCYKFSSGPMPKFDIPVQKVD